jgi:thiosulfate/3-mercaptopyruvate sulfurtransferase
LLVDARSTDRFLAETEEPRAGLRSGHISVQYSLYATTEKVLPKEALKKYFQYQKPLIFSCGSGVTACINMIAYELVSDNLKQFMMDLGPNGDKRKITN